MKSYVALLRGINVGGNKKVSMAELKAMLEKLGFEKVKTLLNSGNVIFETDKDFSTLKNLLETNFENKFGFKSNFIVIPSEIILKLIDDDPFKDIVVNKDTRLYVTFLSERPTSKLEIPYSSENGEFKILKVTDSAIVSVLQLTPSSRTVDLMKIIEKEFGKNVTTRNWNTVKKLIQE